LPKHQAGANLPAFFAALLGMVKVVYANWIRSGDNPPAHQAELVTLWRRLWSARGFTPRLLLKQPKKIPKSWYPAPVTRMNISWNSGRARRPGDLMDFPQSFSGQQVLYTLRKHEKDLSALV